MKAFETKNEYSRRTGKEMKIEELAEVLDTSKEELWMLLDQWNLFINLLMKVMKREFVY